MQSLQDEEIDLKGPVQCPMADAKQPSTPLHHSVTANKTIGNCPIVICISMVAQI